MTKKETVHDTYILDTYKQVESGKYSAGAVTFHGRRKTEAIRWSDKEFNTEEEANMFVRNHFKSIGLDEAANEGELAGAKPMWSMRFGQ